MSEWRDDDESEEARRGVGVIPGGGDGEQVRIEVLPLHPTIATGLRREISVQRGLLHS